MPEQNTPLRRPTLGERVRALGAKIRRSWELAKHGWNQHKKKSKTAAARRLRSIPVYRALGAMLYNVGFQTEYLFVRSGRFIVRGAGRLWRISGRLVRRLMWTLSPVGLLLWEDILLAPFTLVRGLWRILHHAVQVARAEGLWRALGLTFKNLGKGVRRYAPLLPRLLIYALPVVTGVVCWGYVQTQLNRDYALEVQVNDTPVGYVAGESVFEAAKSTVYERISYAGTSETEWSVTPTYTLATVENRSSIMTAKRMADAILQASSDEIQEGTALYIDGGLRKVTTQGDELKAYLEELKAPFETDDPDVSVTFNHVVETVDGVFFNDSFTELENIITYLGSDEVKQENYTVAAGDSISLIATKNGLTQSELYMLNPGLTGNTKLYPGDTLIVQKQETVLEVRITKKLVYNEAIPYSTKTTSSSDYKFGTTKVVQQGVDGVREITALQTYDAQGTLLNTQVLSTQVLQEPVTKEVIRGTRLDSGDVAQLGSGSLIWPCPGYRYCSRWLKPGHKGVDICGAIGTPIYAADAGVVTKAGMNRAGAGSGYGLSIVIDHGNGTKTLYAHCNALYVSAGQSVSQGQQIATLGNTGRSTGPHLHFEIIRNGSYIAPQSLFPGK